MSELSNASQYLLARWILPVSGEPVENACLALDADKIVGIFSRQDYDQLEQKLKLERTCDFGEAIITPGLINLHTHLDYSGLKHFDNYSNFFSWIKGLIGISWQWSAEQWLESALGGAGEIIRSGTSMIVDSSVSGAAAKAVAASGLRGVVGLELFGINEEQADQVFEAWLCKYQSFIDDASPELKKAIDDKRLTLTIAPHTPYSVCPALIRKSLAWAKEKGRPLLIHIAESQAECRWLAAGDEQLDEFLKQAFQGELPPTPWRGHGLTAVEHMQKYGLLDENVLAAHVVQVNKTDVAILARHKVSAAHCARSNSRLRNGIAPLPLWIDAGIEFGFGTDSGASTDDLNVLSEARYAWSLHRANDPTFNESAERGLYYLTLGAARSLKMDKTVGSLDAGKFADLSVFSIEKVPELARARPFECLLMGGAEVVDLVVSGVSLLKPGYKSAKTAAAGRVI